MEETDAERRDRLEAEKEAAFAPGGALAKKSPGDRDGGGIPTTNRSPMLTAGGDPVSDTERLRLRDYTTNLDGIARLMAERQLGDNAVDRRVDGKGMRRHLEIGLPPEYHEELPDQRKYRFGKQMREATDNNDIVQGPIYLPPGYTNGRNYEAPVTAAPQVLTLPFSEQARVVEHLQHWWVLDMDKPERASRDFTGFCRMPKHWVAFSFRWLLEERGLWEPLLDAADPNTPRVLSLQQQFDIRRAHGDARMNNARHFYHYPNVVPVYDQFVEVARATGIAEYVEDPNGYQDKFYFWFHAQERYWFWRHFEKTARQRDEAHRVQDIPEAIAASEALADLMSAVVQPLTTSLIWEIKYDKNDPPKEIDRAANILIHWGTELVRYAPADEVHDLRKTIDFIKQFLMLRRTRAQMLLQLPHVKSSGDLWYPGSWDDVTKEDFMLSLPILSVDAERINQVLQEVLYGPLSRFEDDFTISPGPEIGEWHGRMVFRVLDSFNTLIEMAHHAQRGGKITGDDLRDKWYPKLVQFANDALVRGWWDEGEKRLYADYDPTHPEREFRAVPVADWFLWVDWAWVMDKGGVDHYVFRQIVEYVNEQFHETGLPESVRISIDGADPNYFRHHTLAELISYSFDIEELKSRLRGVWREAIRQKVVHTRPVYQKFLTGLPPELIARLDEPDADGHKFLQELNKKSDRRCRLWAAFQSHGRKGGIRGFKISTAVHWVEEGYGTDNGLSKEKQQGRQADLIMLAWLNDQFDKAVYLVRGITYLISNEVDILKQYDLVGKAIGSGLHPDIAAMVARGLTKDKFIQWNKLLPTEVPDAVKYVEETFAEVEINKLGEKVLEEIKEGRMQIALDVAA